MTQLDPIIAVKDVQASASWYQKIFGFKNAHGGDDFAVLLSETGDIMLCLHRWDTHDHPTLKNQDIPSGNGLLLYFRTENLDLIRKNLEQANWPIEEELHLNTNSLKHEFSFRDPDGYFLTVTEFHLYQG